MSRRPSNRRACIFRYIFLPALVLSLPVPDGWNLGGLPDGATTLVDPPWSHCFGIHRVRQTHLDFYSGYKKKFASPQGIAAVKLYFNDKEGAGDDDELTVYGVNSGSGEIIYNKSLMSLGFYGKGGGGDGEFYEPVAISADRNGLVVVADSGNNRVVFLENVDNELRFLRFATFAESGRALLSPSGVAIEGDKVYIADRGNDRIVVSSRDGHFIKIMETDCLLYGPFAVAVISEANWNYYGSRFLVVTDSLNKRLIRLSLHGQCEALVREGEVSDPDGGFFFLAIDYYSNIYVSDTAKGCLYKFDRFLKFITRFGCKGDSRQDLDEPRGIAIYRRFGQVFVAERAGASYFWVGTDVQNLFCRAEENGQGATLNLRFLLTEQSRVSISLEGDGGETIKVFEDDVFLEPGKVTKSYRVEKKLLPCPFAKCNYFISVGAKPTYSSKKYLEVRKRVPVRMF